MVKRMMKLQILILLFFASAWPVYADMGRILTHDANVREDSQKAIILHNLDEEVLILGTDLVSDRRMKILRFIPFPSEPKVSLAQGDPFESALKLIKTHRLVFLMGTKGGGPSADPVEMRFNARLGAHDATVVKVNQIREFGGWVRKFLKARGLSRGKGYNDVEKIADDYVKRGIRYFVFDLVEVTPELHFVEPLVYRFKSRKFYYPLKTSNTFGGSGGIDLIIIAPGTLCSSLTSDALYGKQRGMCSCMRPFDKKHPFTPAVMASTSAEICIEEADSIYAPARKFFDEREPIIMQFIRHYGEYDFDDDILIDISDVPRGAFGYSPPYPSVPSPLEPERALENRIWEQNAYCKATMAAIEMETKRFEQKLKAARKGPGEPGNAPLFEKRIEKLRADLEIYKAMKSKPLFEYRFPERKTVRVKVTHQYQQGSLLELENMRRSGPFYVVAGIRPDILARMREDDFTSLPALFKITIVPVYPRDYPFPSYYVYVTDLQ